MPIKVLRVLEFSDCALKIGVSQIQWSLGLVNEEIVNFFDLSSNTFTVTETRIFH